MKQPITYTCDKCGQQKTTSDEQAANNASPSGWFHIDWYNSKKGPERLDLCDTCYTVVNDWLHNQITRNGPADAT